MDQEDGRFSEAATTTATSYTDQDLEAETRYRYRIQAVDGQGAKSRRSRQATATTPVEEKPARQGQKLQHGAAARPDDRDRLVDRTGRSGTLPS